MDRMDPIRKLRAGFATADLRDNIWRREDLPKPPTEELADRRRRRQFRCKLFSNLTFSRFLNYTVDNPYGIVAASKFVSDLQNLMVFVSDQVTPAQAKEYREKYSQAKSEAEVTARVLRTYALSAPEAHQKTLYEAAEDIEREPHFACDDTTSLIAYLFDLGNFGQKGDMRAFAIRTLNALVPTGILNRDAMIRDFLQLIGLDATSALVRSTLLNGRT